MSNVGFANISSHSIGCIFSWQYPLIQKNFLFLFVNCLLFLHIPKDYTPLVVHFSLSCIGEGNGNPLQCSCLENPRDGGAWWAAIYGVPQSRTRLKRLSSSSSSGYYKVLTVCHIPCVMQYFVTYLISRTLYLPPPNPCIALFPAPLITTGLFSISVSLLLFLLYWLICYVIYFLDSTYKW